MTKIRWKKVLIIPAIFVAVVLVIYGIDAWFSYEDSGLTQARRMFPLGKNTPYIIVKTDSSGTTVETKPPYVYGIHKPSEATSAAALAWRKIGQSNVDLEKFVNKPVYIEGEYYEGTPLFINTPPLDWYGLHSIQPVIKITNLIPAE